MIAARVRDALITSVIAGLLALPLAGVRTADGLNGMTAEWHVGEVGIAVLLIFLGRLSLGLIADGFAKFIIAPALTLGIAALFLPFSSHFLKIIAVAGGLAVAIRAGWWLWKGRSQRLADETLRKNTAVQIDVPISQYSRMTPRLKKLLNNLNALSIILIVLALIFPFTPLASRYALDVAVMVLTYIMLAWGLNITVGYAGLLDLGYAGFYALGAYSFALLAQHFGIGFWTALPIAGLIAAVTGLLLGLPVLRLRGDYFAIVTLGFGEIVRLVLISWTSLTNGPNGISGIPRPTLFGLDFTRAPAEGQRSFNDFFSIAFDPAQRGIFLYYIILILALAVGWFSARLRRLPLGRAWEAYREDEIACAALGINRWGLKLAAYSLGALVAGIAGAFFATRQGFVSPESFTFTESATMLAIVILGGIGHPLGIVAAAVFIIGMPELFRELEQYRMLAFGAGMVLIMIWRPGGMIAVREPTVRLPPEPTP